MFKKITAIIIAFMLILSVYAYSLAADENRPGIELDGAAVQDDALVKDGSLFLPLRAIAEALGYTVGWLGKDQSITLTKAGDNILIDLKNYKITANEHSYYMSGDYSGLSYNGAAAVAGKTYMGAGFFSENLGLAVHLDSKAGKVVLESVGGNAITIRNMKEASETGKIKITLQYPQIDGLTEKTVQDGINAYFRKTAEAARDEGLKNVEDTAEYSGSPNPYETYFDYRIKYNRNGLLSVAFTDYQYTGGAHGMTVQSSSLLDLKTGGEYKLKELFKDGSDYASIINGAVRGQIDERVKAGMLPEFQDSPFKSIKDGQDFYLSNNGIVIYFQQYEYFPYAAGIQEFTVDYSALKEALKPDFSFLTAASVLPEPAPVGGNAPLYGSKVAYAAQDGLYIADMNGGKSTLAVKGAGISRPLFSGDGESVAYMQDGNLYAYAFAASQSRLLLERADSFCPDGNSGFYASSEKSGIVAVNSCTGESTTIIPAGEDTSYLHLALSPDHRLLAYEASVSGAANQGKGGTWLYDTVSKESKVIAKNTNSDADSLGARPSVGKWSPDSGKLLLWLMSQSASLSADGVGAAVYDVAAGKLTELKAGALAYDENASFVDSSLLAMITGGGREVFRDKNLSQFDLESARPAKVLEIPGLIPAAPDYSADGKKLVFTASPIPTVDKDYKNGMAALSRRQIYLYADGRLSALTDGDGYRSEAPVFLNDNNYIVFARIDAGGSKSVWLMSSDGSRQIKIAEWKYSDPNDLRSMDFYGRTDWSVMFDVFDGGKASGE